jgi:DNA-binding ferritin-like protein (Dps family)
MAARWIELVTGSLEDKKRWRAYKARVQQLPPSYSTAVAGVERYLMYTGGATAGNQLQQMFDDLADLFERAAVDGTPVRAIVGDDPVEFVETFKSNYGLGSWLSKEQRRLTEAIERAENEQETR